MVNFCKLNGFIPVYSVNKRIAKEFIENGIVKKYSEFKHEFGERISLGRYFSLFDRVKSPIRRLLFILLSYY